MADAQVTDTIVATLVKVYNGDEFTLWTFEVDPAHADELILGYRRAYGDVEVGVSSPLAGKHGWVAVAIGVRHPDENRCPADCECQGGQGHHDYSLD